MNKEIRWRQRFSNLEKAFLQLSDACKLEGYSDLEKAGLVQIFEFTFELSWKTMKDLLESLGVEAKFPREVIKAGFQYEIIADGDTWMDMLEKRNYLAHSYDEVQAEEAVHLIREKYYPAVLQLYNNLKQR